MRRDELETTLIRLLSRTAPEMDLEMIDRDEPLQRALDIDSYDFLNFLIAVRDELGVTIDEADYEKVATLSGLVRFVETKLGGSSDRARG